MNIDMDKSLPDILIETRDLIADPNNWICGNWARYSTIDHIPSMCLEGALMVALGTDFDDVIFASSDEIIELQNTKVYQFLMGIAERKGFLNESPNLYDVNDRHESASIYNPESHEQVRLLDHQRVMDFLDEAIREAKEIS